MRVGAVSVRETPVEGRTFSLFGGEDSSDGYFVAVAGLVDRLLELEPDPERLLRTLKRASRRGVRQLGAGAKRTRKPLDAFIGETCERALAKHTAGAAAHVESLTFLKRWDRTLATSERQYHLYMLEIELTNRCCGERFKHAERKLAFLPHCLRDLTTVCKAESDGFDSVCKGCSRHCGVHAASRLLRAHGVTPYIWLSARLTRLFKQHRNGGASLGVLGVACVVELVHGMRLCTRHHIPVVGVPLNANRCARWMGTLHTTSLNVKALETVLSAIPLPARRGSDAGVASRQRGEPFTRSHARGEMGGREFGG
jgi:hypothetical protein